MALLKRTSKGGKRLPKLKISESVDRVSYLVVIDIYFKYGKEKGFVTCVGKRGDEIVRDYLQKHKMLVERVRRFS